MSDGLLRRYIEHVVQCESIDFLDVPPEDRGGRTVLSDDDLTELRRIASEPLDG